MTRHTETPWISGFSPRSEPDKRHYIRKNYDHDTCDTHIAYVAKKDDAKLIVLAVNNHLPLVEALEAAPILSKYHGHGGFDYERFVTDYYEFGKKKRDALASVRGER